MAAANPASLRGIPLVEKGYRAVRVRFEVGTGKAESEIEVITVTAIEKCIASVEEERYAVFACACYCRSGHTKNIVLELNTMPGRALLFVSQGA